MDTNQPTSIHPKVARLSPAKRAVYDKALSDLTAANERFRIERTPETKEAAAAAYQAFDAINPVRPASFASRAGKRQVAERRAYR